ncbi:hypothetical protein FRB96_001715 [Tulasnella sp. 330]|nr:hypothetical protein FRB96_001715 [Tulasnella sp. 330]
MKPTWRDPEAETNLSDVQDLEELEDGTTYDSSEYHQGYSLVTNLVSPCDPCPPPHSWPYWTPLAWDRTLLADMIGPHRDLHVPDALVPPKWTNKWSSYEYYAKWNRYYGDMIWYFNEVLHIHGEPRLVLISNDGFEDSEEGDRGSSELVEVDG